MASSFSSLRRYIIFNSILLFICVFILLIYIKNSIKNLLLNTSFTITNQLFCFQHQFQFHALTEGWQLMLNKIIFNISFKKIKFNIFLLLAIVDDEYFSELASIATPQFYNIIFMGS